MQYYFIQYNFQVSIHVCIPAVLKWCQNDVNFHLSEFQYLYSGPALGPASYEVPLVAGIAPPLVVSSPRRSRAAVVPIHDATCAGHQCQPTDPLPGERGCTHFITEKGVCRANKARVAWAGWPSSVPYTCMPSYSATA